MHDDRKRSDGEPHDSGRPSGFKVDEEPLRNWVLKAHHDRRGEGSERDTRLLEAIRALLSGPDGGIGSPIYWFQDYPDASLDAFFSVLEATRPGLTRSVFDPLLQSVETARTANDAKPVAAAEQPDDAAVVKRSRRASGRLELAPNLSVHIAFLAGPIALRTEIDETVVCSLLSSSLLVLAKLGPDVVTPLLPDAVLDAAYPPGPGDDDGSGEDDESDGDSR